MLPKINRLKKEKEFKKVYRFGRKAKFYYFIIRYNKNNLRESRFGIVTPASKVKKATQRNFIKRRITEIIRANLNKIQKGYDIVILSIVKIEKNTPIDLEKEIINLFTKAELIKRP